MCVLSDTDILPMLDQFVDPADPKLVNPASIDIRIGNSLLYEGITDWKTYDLRQNSYLLPSREFLLVETLETLKVPQGYAVEMKLKSTIARLGFNHSLAFWFDPGWNGIGTLEIQNISRNVLRLYYGMKFAQIIIHKLSSPATQLYQGKYQGALTVEGAK